MNNIKKIRKMLNMSQEEFGKRIGLSRATVGRIESEEVRPTERTIVTICSVFHIRRDYLLYGKEPIWEKSAKNKTIFLPPQCFIRIRKAQDFSCAFTNVLLPLHSD